MAACSIFSFLSRSPPQLPGSPTCQSWLGRRPAVCGRSFPTRREGFGCGVGRARRTLANGSCLTACRVVRPRTSTKHKQGGALCGGIETGGDPFPTPSRPCRPSLRLYQQRSERVSFEYETESLSLALHFVSRRVLSIVGCCQPTQAQCPTSRVGTFKTSAVCGPPGHVGLASTCQVFPPVGAALLYYSPSVANTCRDRRSARVDTPLRRA